MITVTTTSDELKKFEGEWHNKCELEIMVEKDIEHYGWSYKNGNLVVDKVYHNNGKRTFVIIGTLVCVGEEVFEW